MWLGLLIPFFGTTLGSAVVYFMENKNNELLSRCFSGIASGVMVAASIWSLLIPAMEQEKNILIIVLGIFLGAILLLVLDCIVPHMHPGTNDEEGKESHLKKTTKLVFAVTLHNIPEGMAISVPLISGGMSKMKAVFLTALSGFPTVLGAFIGYAIGDVGPIGLSLSLSFASGAMLYVVYGEIIPQALLMHRSKAPAFAIIMGLIVGLLIIYI